MNINRSIQLIGRLITAIIVIGITAFFTPGFNSSSLWILVIGIGVLCIIDFFIGNYTRLFFHPYLKLLIGFVLSGIVLYIVQHAIIGYTLSLLSIVLGAIVYGLVDYMLPNEELNGRKESEVA
ncbi:MAG: phage holin family protein [Clostridia bacterium]|nr:phage holin family protein [Clostridia bacterium]